MTHICDSKLSLVQTMACRLDGAKSFSGPMMKYCELDPLEQTSVKKFRKSYIFIQDNTFENVVWEMVQFFSRSQCVKGPDSTVVGNDETGKYYQYLLQTSSAANHEYSMANLISVSRIDGCGASHTYCYRLLKTVLSMNFTHVESMKQLTTSRPSRINI